MVLVLIINVDGEVAVGMVLVVAVSSEEIVMSKMQKTEAVLVWRRRRRW